MSREIRHPRGLGLEWLVIVFLFAVELAVVCGVYGALIVMAIRFTAESTLRDTISVMPAGLRDRLNRLLAFA